MFFVSPIDFDFRPTADVLRAIEKEWREEKSSDDSCLCSFFSTVADPLDHATGLEKREMLARLAGNDVSVTFPVRLTRLFGHVHVTLL